MAFIPIFDSEPHRFIRFAFVNWTLIAVSVVIYLLQQGGFAGASQAAVVSFGLIPATFNDLVDRPADLALIPDKLTLLTYSFLHGNFWHLAGNMLFFWVFGDNVEDSLGHVRYALFYFLCAAGGGIAYVLSAGDSQSPLIGASGAAAGVVAAYLILHPHAKVWVLVLFGIPVRLTALWVLGFWIALQLYAIATAAPGEVAYWAHVGGFVAGAVLVPFMKRRGVRLFDRGGPAVDG